MEKKYIAIVSIIALSAGLASAVYLYQILNPPFYGSFLKTEELQIISVTFPTSNSAVISITDTGASTLTIQYVTINDVVKTLAYGGSIGTDGSLAKDQGGTLPISSWTWTAGNKYTFAIITTSGNKFTYTAVAP